MSTELRPDVIIAGTPKGGTTSLFRYLADHPAICAADIKEIRFFTRHHGCIDVDALQEYAGHFQHCPTTSGKLKLEASPGYLFRGPDIVEEMRAHVGEAKLVFLLREPVSRLVSLFVSKQTKSGEINPDVSFDDYLDICLGKGDIARLNSDPVIAKRMADRVHEGCYLEGLRAFFQDWPRERIFVGYFEELAQDPTELLRRLCVFLGIDPGFFDDYVFVVENRTRAPRYPRLHRMVHGLNRRFERGLNRVPVLRRLLRAGYNRVATVGRYDGSVPAEARARLAAWYAPRNAELCGFLREKGIALPVWLEDAQ